MKREIQLEAGGFSKNLNGSKPPAPLASPAVASSSEIKDDEDAEGNSIATCRICLECDGKEDDDLISPCMCKGTQRFVHRSCLNHWRSVKEANAFSHCTTCKAQFHLQVVEFEENSWRKIKFRLFVARDVFLVFLAVQTVIGMLGGFTYLCDKNGSLRDMFNDKWDRILSRHPIPFYYCVGVVLFLVLVGIIGIIIHCSRMEGQGGGSTYFCFFSDSDGDSDGDLEGLLVLLIIIVVISGILGIVYGFIAATMAFQRIWQRHYHILTKRQLTKEYVVEDLNGCYTPPNLDPGHLERLKTLELL